MGLKNIKVENYSSKEYEINNEKSLIKTSNKKYDFSKIKGYAKEISLLVLAFSLIGIGYSNYRLEETQTVASTRNELVDVYSNSNSSIAKYQNEESLGDARLVSSDAIVENNEVMNSNQFDNSNVIDKSVTTSNDEDYFTKTKLERDSMYSQTLETYQKMIENTQLSNEQKAIAIQEVSRITNEKNAIQISENLIKNKGYENVVILINGDNVNVVVKAKKLETEDIAKIQNIIAREMNVELNKINISCR